MRKWKIITKRMTVLLLTVMLSSTMLMEQAHAQEQNVQDDIEVSVPSGDDNTETEFGTEGEVESAAAEDTSGSDNTIQTIYVQDTDSGQKTEEDGQQGWGTEDTESEEMPEFPDAVAVPIPMDSTNKLYDSLSQFLSLSSEQFQIYTVAIIDPATKQPVQPDNPVQISLDVPSGYAADRVVVSEVSMDGETPVRMELPFTYNNGKALFESDHSGIYIVMEKKVQVKLPDSLEMTSKVEKLELTKKYPDSVSLTSSAGSLTVNPQTGDDNSVLIWGVATAIAAAAVVALIVIIIKRRK